MIIRAIGRGGMGEVYIARSAEEALPPLAALKRLRPDVARIPTFAERFKHESELAVLLVHDNIVSTLDVGSVPPEDQLYVASELIFGKDTGIIADRLRERGQGAPVAVVIRLLLDVLAGLSYVHGARGLDGRWLALVHRDVTPGNVLVGYDGVAKLADFGLAKSMLTDSSQLTGHGEIIGTPHYLAPEIIRGEKAAPASDIYGAGAVMYRVLTGIAPHQGTTAEVLFKALSEKPRHLMDLRPDLPQWFAAFVHRMMEPEVSRRPAEADQLGKQLEHEALRANLLLPHASVGRWLSALFENEKAGELDERERVKRIDPHASPPPVEGTRVLARVRPGSRFEQAASKAAEPPARPHKTDPDSEGTELELPEAKIREALGMPASPRAPAAAAASKARRSRPPDAVRSRLDRTPDPDGPGAPRPLTGAALERAVAETVAHQEVVPSALDEAEINDGVPTWAMPFPRIKPGEPEPLTTKGEAAGAQAPMARPISNRPASAARVITRDHEILDPASRPRVDTEDSIPDRLDHLPGFVDTGDHAPAGRTNPGMPAASESSDGMGEDLPTAITHFESSSGSASSPAPKITPMSRAGALRGFAGEELRAEGDTDPPSSQPPVAKTRPRNLDSVVVVPVPGGTGSDRRVPVVAAHTGREVGPTDKTLDTSRQGLLSEARGSAPVPVPAPPEPPPSVTTPTPQGRPILVSILLSALLAVAAGVGIGLGIASSRDGEEVMRVEAISPELLTRFQAARKALDDKKARGEPVPAEGWELVGVAGAALLDGDAQKASEAIDKIERLLR